MGFASLLVAFFASSCGDEKGPVIVGETSQAVVTVTSCTAFHPPRSVDIYYGGVCTRYIMPQSPATAEYTISTGGTQITHVDTGPFAAAWVCDTASPAGAPGAPCYSGGINDGYRRVRGAYVGGAYQAASRDITGIVGRSVVISLGTLISPGLPTCPYLLGQGAPPTHWHACGTVSDMGLPDYTANNDPTDSTTCCQISAQWPSGYTGSACTANDNPGVGYSTVNYYCPVY